MRQFLLIFYLLLSMLAAVNADDLEGPVYTIPAYPETVTFSPLPDSPDPIACPTSWNDDSICTVIPGAHAILSNAPSVKTFDFIYIKWMQDDYYEVLVEFELGDDVYPVSTLRSIFITRFDYSMLGYSYPNLNMFGNSPYHFYLKFAMKTKRYGQYICTTPFELYYSWEGSSSTGIYRHSCDGTDPTIHNDFGLVCWEEQCSRDDAETTTESEETTIVTTTEPEVQTTIETLPPQTATLGRISDFPDPVPCPKSWRDDIICGTDTGPTTGDMGYPEVKKFEFVSIKWIQDDMYEGIVEFEVDCTVYPLDILGVITIGDLPVPSGMETFFSVYYPDQNINLLGDSPCHFYFKFVMTTQKFDQYTCTKPFYVFFGWNLKPSPWYAHGCVPYQPDYYGVDSRLVCWEEGDCDEPSDETTTGFEETSQSEELTTIEQTTEAEETTESDYPVPVTVTRPNTDLPSATTDVPTSWNSDSICSTSVAQDDEQTKPEVEIFDFVSINWIEGNYYEVMIEFKIDGYSYTESDLRAIYIYNLVTPDGYLQSLELYVASLDINLLGNSPFHFFFSWVMEAQDLDQYICTTPFTIMYDWDTYFAEYKHGCDLLTDSPLRCWDQIYIVESTESDTEPSTVAESSSELETVEETTADEETTTIEPTSDSEETNEPEETTGLEYSTQESSEIDETTTELLDESTEFEGTTGSTGAETTSESEESSNIEETTNPTPATESEEDPTKSIEESTQFDSTTEQDGTSKTNENPTIGPEDTTSVEQTIHSDIPTETESTPITFPISESSESAGETLISSIEHSDETESEKPTSSIVDPTDPGTGNPSTPTSEGTHSPERVESETTIPSSPATTNPTESDTKNPTDTDTTSPTTQPTGGSTNPGSNLPATSGADHPTGQTSFDTSQSGSISVSSSRTQTPSESSGTAKSSSELSNPTSETGARITTITRPDTTYATTITGTLNPSGIITTISDSDTTYVTTIYPGYPQGTTGSQIGRSSSNIPVNPNDPSISGKPDAPVLQQDEQDSIFKSNILTYTSDVTTAFVSDGKTYQSVAPVIYTTNVPDGASEVTPQVMGTSTTSASYGSDPDNQGLIDQFGDSATSITVDIFEFCLCLFTIVLFI